jgi:E3 ubiquitin-protein ligase RNF213
VLAMTVSIVYLLRLGQKNDIKISFDGIEKSKQILEIFDTVSLLITQEALDLFGENGDDVTLNRPLRENLIVLLTSISLGMHVLICGKPGTSKTLAIEIASKVLSMGRTNK